MNRFVLVVLLLAASGSSAYDGSTFIEGNELKQMCEGLDDDGNATSAGGVACIQFVMGVHDTMSTLTYANQIDDGFVCFPKAYNAPQLALDVKRFLGKNEDRLDEPGNILVATTFTDTYSCD